MTEVVGMDRCPACDSAVSAEDAVCPSCGVRLVGATASFEPVAAETSAGSPEPVSADGPVLVVHKGAEVGERFYIDRDRLSVGRDPESDIFLNDVTVSRSHAILHLTPEGVTVEDAGSLNGTYLNDLLVDKALLHSGDALQIGRFRMIFLSGGGA
jgi:hypothetical protein